MYFYEFFHNLIIFLRFGMSPLNYAFVLKKIMLNIQPMFWGAQSPSPHNRTPGLFLLHLICVRKEAKKVFCAGARVVFLRHFRNGISSETSEIARERAMTSYDFRNFASRPARVFRKTRRKIPAESRTRRHYNRANARYVTRY